MTDIFLSYNRDDQDTARRFAEGFERQGFGVWWDQTLRSGEAYDEVTEGELRGAKAVVVLWSKKSVVSRWVRAEATLADRNRTLVPAMIEPCERPIMFELTQTADLSKWGGEANDRTWLAFLTDVQRFVGAGGAQKTAAASIPTPAIALLVTEDGRPSLAILPFTNRSGERADDVFADGMVEDLIGALSLSGAMKVIAQSATLVYRKNVSDLRAIGRELGVRYLLEGNVRRVGVSLRVTAQLVAADDAAILWTQKFDRPLTELAELQEELVMELAGHLGVELQRVETEKALKKPGDLTAWEATMRSMVSLESLTRESLVAGISEARKAISIAPNYSLAHAALACELATLYFSFGGAKDESLAREARVHAERALLLVANDPIAMSWAALAMGFCGQWREALPYAQRSVDLNPNIANSRRNLAVFCIRLNRPDEAIPHLDAAAVLAPRGSMSFLGFAYRALAHYLAGRYEQALSAIRQAVVLNPGFIYSLKDKATICAKLELREEAQVAVRSIRKIDSTVTMDDLDAANNASFIPPEAAAEMNAILRKVWEDTPVTA